LGRTRTSTEAVIGFCNRLGVEVYLCPQFL
jgi:hypothetical protein